MWVNIDGYDGRYQVSESGQVRSVDWVVINKRGIKQVFKGKMLKPTVNALGYYTVTLTKDGRGKPVLLHRIIAKAFIPNPLGYNEINHIDENKLNNSIGNLEWCTHLHNVRHGTAIERASLRKINNPATSNIVAQISNNGAIVAYYPSVREASRVVGIHPNSIIRCCRGERKTTGGFHWRYVKMCKRSINRINKRRLENNR